MTLKDKEVIRQCQQDSEFMWQVIQENKNLIWYSIKQQLSQMPKTYVDDQSLFDEACLSCMKAIKRCDLNRDTSPLSYIITVIKRDIRDYIAQNTYPIAMSHHTLKTMRPSVLRSKLSTCDMIEWEDDVINKMDAQMIIQNIMATLTPHEQTLLQLLLKEYTHKEISYKLKLSRSTVNRQIKRMFHKIRQHADQYM